MSNTSDAIGVNHTKPLNTGYDIQQTRDRQTESDTAALSRFTLATTDLLLSGTAIAAGAIGGPGAAMAVAQAGAGLQNTIASGAEARDGAAAGGALNTMSQVERMQSEGMASSFQLLALQQKVQDENRQFTTLSNVMRARHDTDKAAIGNIRS